MGKLILGIDPGFGRVGYGIIEESGRENYNVLEYGCVETNSKELFVQRLMHIEKECIALLEKYKPDVVAIEQLFFTKNITTGIKVSEARGVIQLTAAKAGVQIVEFTPTQIKSIIAGHGKADKKQMQRMVQMLLRLKEMPKQDDAADALAVALCGFLVN